ncbi:transcriptional regulator [Actinocorallia herbida]|uniref:Transcriptional regulator n=1 Tax=Actinocorallia herbida TaxID=58109 RepID=A0A3N1D1N1_9ACTN|nr:MarR family winged helix-turn-helix transcriptional regulator [Actinocorallia herbida]ROO87422.1 transcriptional regulator [Actinocorallia herbida]
MGDAERGMPVVHGLRAVTVDLHLLGAAFAHRHGLHPTDLRALIALLDAARSGAPATPGRLGAALGLNSAGTTALLDRLERLGHIRRARDPRDRRRVLIEVTGQATALGEDFFAPVISDALTALAAYSDADLAVVLRFLTDIQAVADAHRPE